MTEPNFSTTIIQLRAAQAGDRQALEELLQRYRPRICKAVVIRLGTAPHRASDVDDVVQEVMLAAYRDLDKFQPRSDATFMSWLTTLAANKVCDRLRRDGRKKHGGGKVRSIEDLATETSSEPQVASPDPSVSQLVRTHELVDAEMQALAQLPPQYREVIADHDVLGLTFEEIAEKYGYATAEPPRALHRRALRKLGQLMRPFDDRRQT